MIKIATLLFLLFTPYIANACTEKDFFFNTKESDDDNDGIYTIDEILIERSLIPAKIQNKKVVSGEWYDEYMGVIVSTDMMIGMGLDHLVLIDYAIDNGACEWTTEKKMQFANERSNLVITSKRYAKSKQFTYTKMPGDNSWVPAADSCLYLARQVLILNKYELPQMPWYNFEYNKHRCFELKEMTDKLIQY
jgi:hypothetical protein